MTHVHSSHSLFPEAEKVAACVTCKLPSLSHDVCDLIVMFALASDRFALTKMKSSTSLVVLPNAIDWLYEWTRLTDLICAPFRNTINAYLSFSDLLFSVKSSPFFTLSIIPANQPVLIGEEVILTCQVKGLQTASSYSVLFKHGEQAVSERCNAYEPTKYRVVCEPEDWKKATIYKFYIKSVSWADRGVWSCIFAANAVNQTLEVHGNLAWYFSFYVQAVDK